MIEGCQTENVDIINWNEPSLPAVRFSRMLSSICRHDKDFHLDDFGLVSLEDILINKE